MKKKRLPFLSLFCICLSIICGCAAVSQNTPETVSVKRETAEDMQLNALRLSAEKYRSLARAYEKDQQLYKAAFMWIVVQRLKPEDQQARKKIMVLEERIQSGADQYLLQGKEHVKQKSFLSARNDYLMTLAYHPFQKEALEWLKNSSSTDGYILYETRPGDTTRTVAQNVYADSGKDFIVAYFSGLKDDDYFKPGTALKLPVIESQLSQPEASKPRHVSVPAPQLRPLKVYDKAGAEEHYRKGVSYFIAEDMQKAIKEWEETLNLDPDHPNARRNIEKARKFLKNGRAK